MSSTAVSFAIRPATRDDIPAVLELWRLAGALPTRTDDEGSIRALIEHDPEALLLSIEAGEAVGSLIAGFDGWRGSLFRMAVLPSHRRRGVATALVAEGERSLRQRGAARITFFAIRAESEAIAFWDSTGFARDERALRFVKNLSS